MVDAVAKVLFSLSRFNEFQELLLEGTFICKTTCKELSSLCRVSAGSNELLGLVVEVRVCLLEVFLEDEEVLKMVKDEFQQRNVEGRLKI